MSFQASENIEQAEVEGRKWPASKASSNRTTKYVTHLSLHPLNTDLSLAWSSVKPTSRGKSQSQKGKPSKKRAPADNDSDDPDGSDNDEVVERKKQKSRPKSKLKGTVRPPPAALLDEDSEDEEPLQYKMPTRKPDKRSQKKPASKNSRQRSPDGDSSDEEDDLGRSAADSEQLSNRDDDASGSEEDDSDEMDEHSLDAERPQVIKKAVFAKVDDDDGDVEIRSRPSSQAGTNHPTSSDEGCPTLPSADGTEEQDEHGVNQDRKRALKNQTGRKRSRSHVDSASSDEDGKVPVRKAQKTQKKQRDEIFGLEKPAVGPAKTLKTSKGKPARRHQPDLEHTKLCLPSNGRWKGLNLLDQPPLVQQVTRGAIERVTLDFFLKCAWRSGGTSRLAYGRPILLEVAESLRATHPKLKFKDISNCLEKDERYAQSLSYLVVDRLVLLRNPAKIAGAQTVPLFKLGLGEECKERIGALFPLYVYVFPGVWKFVEGQETNQWVPNAKEPYTNPAIINTLKEAFFSSSHGAGTRHIDHFPVKNGQRQIPIPLLALAATGVHYGLYQYKDGSKNDKLPFSGNIFTSIYMAHEDALKTLSTKSNKTFRCIMSTIFDLVAANSKASTSSGGNDIFSVIELDEGDNDDDN
ncbi:hypothetical protein BKA70DRAFT_1224936 [Coprinopsis sp. MPI-PUGE-AT-0042]|nr:hypothetical protein BKA70DRAFT_1224936 [Coprinopsis sp. MPI-PUGE-AT-0042]